MPRALYIHTQTLRADSPHARRTFQMLTLLARAGVEADVLTLPANNVYVVKGGERELMIPAVPQFIAETNIEQGYIRVNMMEGL